MSIRLMVAVPQLFREGICKILGAEKYIKIVAEASAPLEIIALVEQNKPDVLFIDTAISSLDMVKLLESIEEKSPKTKILLLIHAYDDRVAANAIFLGAQRYLTAASGATHLIYAIRAANKDKMWTAKKIITRSLPRTLSLGRDKLGFFESKPIKRRREHKTRVIQATK
jgi:DNA-binding NarL/FixJ family response regulator